ncbi:MAG: FAD-binding oxidoreductase [Bauldia sp.]
MAAVAVVGGGLIGSAAAAWLLADGFDVTLFERDPDGRPASTGNAGVISLPEISPLARPGTLMSVPGWLMDPLGPLSLRARDLPALTPWLARFALSARPSQVERSTVALGFLMKTALADHQELARRAGLGTTMRRTGALYLYDTDPGFASALGEWKERARHGVDYREVSVAEARAMVPALKGGFARALFTPESWTVSSPIGILRALRAAVGAQGRLATGAVETIRREANGVTVVTANGDEQPFDRVIVAGGIWSRDLVRGLGLYVLLEAERGYNTTFPSPGFDIEMPVFATDHGFVATPLADGLRVGGAVELAACDAPPNYARAGAMCTKMRRYLPDLPEAGGTEWMGCRPSTPDSLPVIGPHPKDPRIVFAFGHGHLGLTLSAVTARHVASLIGGRARERNLKPFGIERFQ